MKMTYTVFQQCFVVYGSARKIEYYDLVLDIDKIFFKYMNYNYF